MFNTNPSTAVWSTCTVDGNLIEAITVKSKIVHRPTVHAEGEMTIRVIVWNVDNDVDDILYRAVDALADNINGFSEDAKQLFDAENIRIDDRFDVESSFRQIDPCTFVARLKWTGDAIPDTDADLQPLGYSEWMSSRGV